jgi:hypothetical protein
MAQGLQYHIDIVFCIDVTGSMGPVIDVVKENVRKFPSDLRATLDKKGKIVNTLRIRTIAFRDFGNDTDALSASEFFVVEPSTELAKFESFVNGLSASGGGDEPESALEALGIAQSSAWTHDGDKQRHVIVMFTDASAHKLESRVGEVPAALREQVPGSLDDLTDRWEGKNQGVRLLKEARRLLVFGPDAYPWNVIGDSWSQTIWLPSQAGSGLDEVEYETILKMVSESI